jgi:signal transduction histidine kinase
VPPDLGSVREQLAEIVDGLTGVFHDLQEISRGIHPAILSRAAKHAQAKEVWVAVDTDGPNFRLSIRDDGIGGADSGRGAGLIGLRDRAEALGGHLQISSPIGSGTSLQATIPLSPRRFQQHG